MLIINALNSENLIEYNMSLNSQIALMSITISICFPGSCLNSKLAEVPPDGRLGGQNSEIVQA